MRHAAVLLLLAGVATPAQAQDACSSFSWPTENIRANISRADLPSVKSATAATASFNMMLVAHDQAGFPLPPQRVPKRSGTFGGYVSLSAPPDGMLQVSVSDDAWVDLVQDGQHVATAAFSGKQGCPGLRKIVRFAAKAGVPAILEISGVETDHIRIDMQTAH